MDYLHWNEQKLTDFSEDAIAKSYELGYVFTRIGKGAMQQTRSVRIDLTKFSLTSENRRILKKVGDMTLQSDEVPTSDYDWTIGKLAKDFYETRFGRGIMSAHKIKEMMTDKDKSNFNRVLIYSIETGEKKPIGYAICYASSRFIHYSYPFYDLANSPADMGLGMMIMAIQYAKGAGMKYIYLGSLQRPNDVYKLQFEGLEWFDGKVWQSDVQEVKKILANDYAS